jgi:hypothetical protein
MDSKLQNARDIGATMKRLHVLLSKHTQPDHSDLQALLASYSLTTWDICLDWAQMVTADTAKPSTALHSPQPQGSPALQPTSTHSSPQPQGSPALQPTTARSSPPQPPALQPAPAPAKAMLGGDLTWDRFQHFIDTKYELD